MNMRPCNGQADGSDASICRASEQLAAEYEAAKRVPVPQAFQASAPGLRICLRVTKMVLCL